jgi:hypothetical protein
MCRRPTHACCSSRSAVRRATVQASAARQSCPSCARTVPRHNPRWQVYLSSSAELDRRLAEITGGSAIAHVFLRPSHSRWSVPKKHYQDPREGVDRKAPREDVPLATNTPAACRGRAAADLLDRPMTSRHGSSIRSSATSPESRYVVLDATSIRVLEVEHPPGATQHRLAYGQVTGAGGFGSTNVGF